VLRPSLWLSILLPSFSYIGCTTTTVIKPGHFIADTTRNIYLTTKEHREIYAESGNFANDTTRGIPGIRIAAGLVNVPQKRDVPYGLQKRNEPFSGVLPLDSLETIEMKEFSVAKTTFLVLGTAAVGFIILAYGFASGLRFH
jgi:hypothetical protein